MRGAPARADAPSRPLLTLATTAPTRSRHIVPSLHCTHPHPNRARPRSDSRSAPPRIRAVHGDVYGLDETRGIAFAALSVDDAADAVAEAALAARWPHLRHAWVPAKSIHALRVQVRAKFAILFREHPPFYSTVFCEHRYSKNARQFCSNLSASAGADGAEPHADRLPRRHDQEVVGRHAWPCAQGNSTQNHFRFFSFHSCLARPSAVQGAHGRSRSNGSHNFVSELMTFL